VLRGSSGFYTYGIYEHKEGWPDFGLGETRVTFKLRKDKLVLNVFYSANMLTAILCQLKPCAGGMQVPLHGNG
jgi:hypothetical protein